MVPAIEDPIHEPLLEGVIEDVPPGREVSRAGCTSTSVETILPIGVPAMRNGGQSGRGKWLKALRAGAILIGLAGFSYGVLLASVLIRMAPIKGLVGRFGGSSSTAYPPSHYHNLFITIPNNASAARSLEVLTAAPHVAGTKEDLDTAAFVDAKFKEFGLASHYADYNVLLSYPIKRRLSIVHPFHRTFTIKEAAFEEDPYSKDPRVIDTFHAYSPSGKVVAEVVYSNFGRTEDFEKLAELGVNCTGAIVISRYGRIFRGDKGRNAAKAGAIASLVYSDPRDAAASGKEGVYPNSQWLPPSGVQRGSIAAFKGDPLTPGWPSTEGCEQLDVDADNLGLPPIPSLPISYQDALPIMAALGGQVAPKDWWGALNMSEYRLGPGPVKVELELEMNLTVGPIRNVIAVIPGSEEPDRYVILGNHRDAWTFGAVDPNSGTAALTEVARGFGALLEAGWQPRRTIILANWDAEEYALIGSTEWVEGNEDVLGARAVAYLNVDTGVVGIGAFSAAASPQLDNVVMGAAKRVADPIEPSYSLYDKWVATANVSRADVAIPEVRRLGGAGSDFAGFLQHLGISSVDMLIAPPSAEIYPMYHSTYDNFYWMSHFGDPGFHYHAAIAAVWGLAGLILADSAILPFNFQSYAQELKAYADSLDENLENAHAPSFVTTDPIHRAVSTFYTTSVALAAESQALQDRLDSGWANLDSTSGGGAIDQRVRELNDRLMLAERAFVAPEGVPGRPWFRHLIYAPADDNGYATTVFPSVTDAVGRVKHGVPGSSWRLVQHEIHRVARAIGKASNVLTGNLH